jgi:hypothetical protein
MFARVCGVATRRRLSAQERFPMPCYLTFILDCPSQSDLAHPMSASKYWNDPGQIEGNWSGFEVPFNTCPRVKGASATTTTDLFKRQHSHSEI